MVVEANIGLLTVGCLNHAPHVPLNARFSLFLLRPSHREPSGKLRQQLQEQYVRIAVLEDDAKDDDMDMDHAAPRPLTHTELKARAERALERAARGIAERAAAVAAQPHGMARLGATAKARSIRSAMTSTRGRS